MLQSQQMTRNDGILKVECTYYQSLILLRPALHPDGNGDRATNELSRGNELPNALLEGCR